MDYFWELAFWTYLTNKLVRPWIVLRDNVPLIKKRQIKANLTKNNSDYSSKPLEAGNSENDVKMENIDLSQERIDKEP